MGIKEEYLVPEFYIKKQAYCDECNIELEDTGRRLLVNPPLIVMKCTKCNKEYHIRKTDLDGEWKFKTI